MRSRCSGRVGAIENPQFPATTVVTPWCKRAAGLLQQDLDTVGVVVGDGGPHAQVTRRRLRGGQVEQQVERIDGRLGGDVLEATTDEPAMRRGLHHLVRVPTRRQPLPGGPTVTHPLAPVRVGVRLAALVDRPGHELGEDR